MTELRDPLRTLAVVTDSTADIPPEMAALHGIEVVPLLVHFGDECFTDGVLTQEEFFERMRAAPELPTTSQPSVGAFSDVYESLLERFSEVVSVHIAAKLSGTIESAHRAAEQFGGRVHVVDSYTLSWALGWQVREAAAAAAEGLGVAEVLDRVHSVRDRVRLIVGIDSLENLARGGRIGGCRRFLGSLLNLKVTFEWSGTGEFQPLARSRGERAAMEHTLEWVSEQMGSARRAGSPSVMLSARRERFGSSIRFGRSGTSSRWSSTRRDRSSPRTRAPDGA